MGFSNKTTSTVTPTTGTSGLTKKLGGTADVSTYSGLKSYAESKGITPPTDKPGFLTQGIQTASNILLAPSRFIGKLMGGKEGEFPSEVLFGKQTKQFDNILDSIKYQLTTFDGLKRFVVDTLTDPLMYLTLGVGGAVRVATKEGASVILEKTAQQMLKDTAEELVQQGFSRNIAVQTAKEQVGKLVSKEGATILERGGLQNIIKGLETAGKKITAQEIKSVLEKGIPELIKKSAVRFAGQPILSLPKWADVYNSVSKTIKSVEAFKPLVEGLETTGKAIAKLFSRDFGLPKAFIPVKQKFIDSFDAATSRIKQDLSVVFSGTTKEQRVAVAHAIDKGTVKELPKELIPLADRTKKIFARIATEEEKRGLLDKTLTDYIPHIYKNREKAANLIDQLRNGQASANLRFNKMRILPDLEAAKVAGLDPIEDIAELLHIRLMASERAKLTQDFIGEISQKFGIAKDVLKTEKGIATDKIIIKQIKETNPEFANKIISLNGDGLTRLSDVVAGVPKEIASRDIFIPKNIADDLAKISKRFFADEDAKSLLVGYDKMNNFWKGSVTVMFPAFHFRNAVSNVFQSFLDIGVQSFNPAVHVKVVDILTGAEGKIINELGEEITYSQIRKLAKEYQIFQDTLARTDVGRLLSQSAVKKLNPFDLGRKAGRAIENEARMVNFVTNLRRGFTPSEAAARTKQFLFDYDNLSLFEKDVMRRAIPFYTWTRKNIAQQLKAIVTQPGKQAVQIRMFKTLQDMFGFKQTDEEKKFVPDWIKQGLNILIDRQGDDRTFLTGFDWPLETFFEDMAGFVDNPFKKVLNFAAPYLKAPIELATGKNLFSDLALSDDDSGVFAKNLPEPIRNWLDYHVESAKDKAGTPFDIITVDPKKKWVFKNVTSIAGVGRLTSSVVLNGTNSLYRFIKGEKLSYQDRGDILALFSGVRASTISLESETRKQEKTLYNQLQALMERKGETATFFKTFIPKQNKGGLQKKL